MYGANACLLSNLNFVLNNWTILIIPDNAMANIILKIGFMFNEIIGDIAINISLSPHAHISSFENKIDISNVRTIPIKGFDISIPFIIK